MNCSDSVSQQAAEINVQNLKNILDSYVAVTQQATEDNQSDARAWAALKLRIANNSATVDHAINAGLVTSNQTGTTENQQSVSPIRTGTGDAIAGTIGVSADQVAANIAALSDVVTKLSDALTAVVVTAAGGASTPSQTTAKTT